MLLEQMFNPQEEFSWKGGSVYFRLKGVVKSTVLETGLNVALGFLILLACQLVGELLVRGLDVPIPGAVVGMVLLFLGLLLFQEIPDGLRQTSEGLLKVLPLLLVPAGVGIMQYLGFLSEAWAELLTALVISTFATLFIVAFILQRMLARKSEQQDRDPS